MATKKKSGLPVDFFFNEVITKMLIRLSADPELDRQSKIAIVALKSAINKTRPTMEKLLGPLQEKYKDDLEGFTEAYTTGGISKQNVTLVVDLPMIVGPEFIDKLSADEIQAIEEYGLFNLYTTPTHE